MLVACLSAITAENCNDGNHFADDGCSVEAGDGKSGENDGKGDGDVTELYFSNKQNPLKKKIHVTIQTYNVFFFGVCWLSNNAVVNKESCQRSWGIW